MDNNYYKHRYTSCRTYSADSRGKSADGSVNWYTGVSRDGRQATRDSGRICLRENKVFKTTVRLDYVLTLHMYKHTNVSWWKTEK